MKPVRLTRPVLKGRPPLAMTLMEVGSHATSVSERKLGVGSCGRTQLSCSFHSAARRHSFCVSTSNCCVGSWENVSDGDEQVTPLQLCHLLYCLELHNDSNPGCHAGAVSAGMRVFGRGTECAGRRGSQSERGVRNAFWETDGDLFERSPWNWAATSFLT